MCDNNIGVYHMDYRELARAFFETACSRPAVMSSRIDGMSRGEIATLGFLRTRGDMTPGEISACKGVSTARVANILASLTKKGLVERLPDTRDRRKAIVHITEAGTRLAEQKYEEALDDLEQILRSLGEKDAKEYYRITHRIVELTSSPAEDASPGSTPAVELTSSPEGSASPGSTSVVELTSSPEESASPGSIPAVELTSSPAERASSGCAPGAPDALACADIPKKGDDSCD